MFPMFLGKKDVANQDMLHRGDASGSGGLVQCPGSL